MKVLYTEHEGGRFIPLEVEATKEDIVKELEANHVPRTKDDIGSSKLSGIEVKSVLFPDGEVWGCYFGKFRHHDEADNNIWKECFERLTKYYELNPHEVPK